MITAITARNVSESPLLKSLKRGGKGIPFPASEALGKIDTPDRTVIRRKGARRLDEENVVSPEDKFADRFQPLFGELDRCVNHKSRSAGLSGMRLESLCLDKKTAACVMNCSFGVGSESMDLRVISNREGILVEIAHDRNVSIANKNDVAKSIRGAYPAASVVWRERKKD